MIVKELLDIFQILFRKTLPGFFVVLFLVEKTVPLGLGLGHRGDFTAGAVSGMAGFAGLLEQVLAFARVAPFSGHGRGGDESCEGQEKYWFDKFLHDLGSSVCWFLLLGFYQRRPVIAG